ncbi:MAG: 4Fe-4S binding protein [Nitrospirae bacterium]|nr:4Fe-4S binding protein [Nitrospirota bacterium]MBF0518833.1 4Fe-4S binding protein [Nitrospirota bacterium]MBF0535597.1 4Fe-4S binding protein [Nitrospirota bacterium]MBF0617480.1 4Fe-4S binding protein [Nitrospirota bacterium]
MKGKIEINSELCKGCELCITVCPKKILKLCDELNTSGYYTICVTDMERCTGCALCAQICPELTIEVWADK